MRYMNRATGAIIEPPEGAEHIYVNHALYEAVTESAYKAERKKRAPKSAEKEEAT